MAQVLGTLGTRAEPAEKRRRSVHESLAVEKFIHPRPLWWGFDWPGAQTQAKRAGGAIPVRLAGCDPANGVVVLIDEIDKAEADVPNGLLEALGAGEFTPQGLPPVKALGVPPLVLVTTNEERTLPDAFVRRCLVLHLELPDKRDDLIARLVARGAAHFRSHVDDDVLACAAELLAEDREEARRQHWPPYPGQAEFMDLIRAVVRRAPGKGNSKAQMAELKRIRAFVLRKNPRGRVSR